MFITAVDASKAFDRLYHCKFIYFETVICHLVLFALFLAGIVSYIQL